MMFKYFCLVLFITWYQLADCHPASKSAVNSMDSMIEKESEAFLTVEAEESSHKNNRDKRTVGFLRQLFPNLSQIVDRKIQSITRFLFRVIGRLVLRGGAGGGAGAGAGGGGAANGGGADSGNGRRISITLPTYPPSADDEEEEQTEVPAAPDASGSGLPGTTTSPADVVAATDPSPTAAATDSSPAASATDSPTTIPATTTTSTTAAAAAAVTTQMPSDSDNTVSIVKRAVREVSPTEESSSPKKRSPLTDTENDESVDNELSNNANDNTEDQTAEPAEDPRNKRFLFNLRGRAGGNGGGGSGNFLFDLIRRGADRAARAAGGFYRVVAGTDPNTLTLAQPLQYPSLVAGSGANQDRDESSDAPLEHDNISTRQVSADVNPEFNTKEDGYSVGVPGPLTRIFVIANRGVANLVQDLILRLAQTTERLVNFKARLITSLI